jgi:hypothetical protein
MLRWRDMPPVALGMLQTNILHVLFADGQAIIAEMGSHLQQALHILHAILKKSNFKISAKTTESHGI